MITDLRIKGFKSWSDTGNMPLAPVTALFGTNSSGKTSILQLLLMLKQTAESPDRSQVLNLGDERTSVELGTFQDVIHGHDLDGGLEWQMDWTLPSPLEVTDPEEHDRVLFSAQRLAFSSRITWQGNGEGRGRAAVERMAYDYAEHEFGMKRHTPDAEREFDLYAAPDTFKFVRAVGRAWPLPPPVKCYGFPDQVRAYYQNASFLSDLELQFEKLFGGMYYLGPLRDHPKRQYVWAGAQPGDMGRRGERVVDALLASRDLGHTISRGRGRKRLTLEQRVADWLRELRLVDSFEVRPITAGGKLFQVWVRRHAGAPEVLVTDVGFGVSQILPVIALCYYVPEGSILLLEQPEIHLHPAVQAGLADVIIDAAQTRNLQIIVESHSEHLLRRLQRRIAEERLAAKDAALYFCRTTRGRSSLTPLQLDIFGTIENWPEGFFGDEFGEIAKTQQAIVRRSQRDAR